MKKQSVIVFLLLGLVLLGGGNLVAQTAGSVLGNVNDDKEINIIDALCTARYAAGFTVTPFSSQLADADGSGAINIVDAMLIAQYATGLIIQLPAEPNSHALDPQYKLIMVPVIDETIFNAGTR